MVRPSPHTIQSPELDAVLACGFAAEFAPRPGNATLLPGEGPEKVWRFARAGRMRLLFVEGAVGDPVPSRRERIAVRDRIGCDRDTIIFADAGHRRFVGTRVRWMAGGFAVYEEYDLPEGSPPPVMPEGARRADARGGHDRRVARARVTASIEGILRRRGHFAGEGTLDRFLRAVAEPRGVRELLGILDRFVVVDRRARSGDWLLGAAEALAWAREAAVSCARGLVADAGAARDQRRPEYLSDLRRIVEFIDARRREPRSVCPVRQLVAQRFVFGCAREPDGARRIRARLEAWVGFEPGEAVGIDTNLTIADPGDLAAANRTGQTADRPPAPPGASLPDPAPPAGQTPDVTTAADASRRVDLHGSGSGADRFDADEVARELAAAWRLMSDERLRPGAAPSDEWRRAAHAFGRRADELRRRLPTSALPWIPNPSGRPLPIILDRDGPDIILPGARMVLRSPAAASRPGIVAPRCNSAAIAPQRSLSAERSGRLGVKDHSYSR